MIAPPHDRACSGQDFLMGHDLSRRTVLKQGLFATVALAAGSLPLRASGAAVAPPASPGLQGPRQRVLVVGAGLAGLAGSDGGAGGDRRARSDEPHGISRLIGSRAKTLATTRSQRGPSKR